MTLMDITRALLADLQNDPHKAKANPIEIARVMGLQGKGWTWTPFVLSALGETYDEAVPINAKTGLNIWKNLPEWLEIKEAFALTIKDYEADYPHCLYYLFEGHFPSPSNAQPPTPFVSL